MNGAPDEYLRPHVWSWKIKTNTNESHNDKSDACLLNDMTLQPEMKCKQNGCWINKYFSSLVRQAIKEKALPGAGARDISKHGRMRVKVKRRGFNERLWQTENFMRSFNLDARSHFEIFNFYFDVDEWHEGHSEAYRAPQKFFSWLSRLVPDLLIMTVTKSARSSTSEGEHELTNFPLPSDLSFAWENVFLPRLTSPREANCPDRTHTRNLNENHVG